MVKPCDSSRSALSEAAKGDRLLPHASELWYMLVGLEGITENFLHLSFGLEEFLATPFLLACELAKQTKEKLNILFDTLLFVKSFLPITII